VCASTAETPQGERENDTIWRYLNEVKVKWQCCESHYTPTEVHHIAFILLRGDGQSEVVNEDLKISESTILTVFTFAGS